MLKESLIANNSIVLNQKAASWEEAVKLAINPLIQSGAVEPRYLETILGMIKEMGPYIILAPGLAMPHARPEDGVVKTAFSLVTLQEPVFFEDDETPISVLLGLAGSDSDTHMEGIMEITQAFDDPDNDEGVNIQKFLDCKTADEVIAVIDAALN